MSMKPAVSLAAVVAVLMTAQTAAARPGDHHTNDTSKTQTITYELNDSATRTVDVAPGKCHEFAYSGSTSGDTCTGNQCAANGGSCIEAKPTRIWLDDKLIFPRSEMPAEITAMLEEHPDWKLVTGIYGDLFYQEIDGERVLLALLDEQRDAAREAFIAAHTRVVEDSEGKRVEIPPEHVYSYLTVEFDWEGNPMAVWKFATEPTVAVVIDGHFAHARGRRLYRDGDDEFTQESWSQMTTEEATAPGRPLGEPK